jgi:branched-chain amino acid transport system substrate-binding protein
MSERTSFSPPPRRSRIGRTLRRIGVPVLVVGVAAAALSACSSSKKSSSSSGSSAANCADARGVTADSIKVAVLASLTGPSAPTFAGFYEAANARIQKENDAGGVNGRKITLVKEDDKGDGATQVIVARDAIESQKAFSLLNVGQFDTSFGYLKGLNVPVMGGNPSQPAYANDRNFFGYNGAATLSYTTTALATRLKKAGATNIGVVAHNSPGAVAGAKAFVSAADKAGLKVGVQRFDIPIGTFDATAVAIQMKNAGIDSVYPVTLVTSGISVIKALKAQGVNLVTSAPGLVYDPTVYPQLADLLQNAISNPANGTVPLELKTPAIQTYVDTMKKYATTVVPSQGFTTQGYIAADMLIRGLKESGKCVTQDGFIDSLRKVSGYDGAGLLVKPIVFSPSDQPDGGVAACNWYATFKGTGWTPDKEATCGELFKS